MASRTGRDDEIFFLPVEKCTNHRTYLCTCGVQSRRHWSVANSSRFDAESNEVRHMMKILFEERQKRFGCWKERRDGFIELVNPVFSRQPDKGRANRRAKKSLQREKREQFSDSFPRPHFALLVWSISLSLSLSCSLFLSLSILLY